MKRILLINYRNAICAVIGDRMTKIKTESVRILRSSFFYFKQDYFDIL